MANFFAQFHEGNDTPVPSAESDNYFAQFHGPSNGSEPGISIPLPWGGSFRPSFINLAKGLFEAGKSGVTLPSDVYQGKVDPLSEQGIQRAADLASLTALPSAGRSLAKPAITAPTKAELQAAATPLYQEATQIGNEIPVVGKGIANQLRDILEPQALRQSNAPKTHLELTRLSGAKDLNDIAIARDKMRDIASGISQNRLIKVAGTDAKAAGIAKESLDARMEAVSPGWQARMAEADANWAASKRMEMVQKEAGKGKEGRLGSFDTNETRVKGYTPEEIAAIKRAHVGGTLGAIFSGLGALNPLQGGLTGKLSTLTHLAAAIPSGGLSLLGIPAGMISEKIAKALKQQAFNQALDKLASRSPLAQQMTQPTLPSQISPLLRYNNPMYRPDIIGLSPLSLPPPTMGLLPFEGNYRQ